MISRRLLVRAAWLAAATALATSSLAAPPPLGPLADRVMFPSTDGKTALVGYVFHPDEPHAARMPAVVMMHGRAGAYSLSANGKYDASTLSQRHQKWGLMWAKQGYVAMLVDGFGPRGYPHGFPRFSYDQRPESLNEVTVRPLDAYGALSYLRTRRDIVTDRIVLQGWSNGASATLAAMAASTPALRSPTPASGFRAGLAFYPACGLKGQFENGLVPYASVRLLVGTADEEISPKECNSLVEKSRAQNGDVVIKLYPGATHDFDDPGPARQKVAANAEAARDAAAVATAFFATVLKP